jgi:hypothetical protein
MKRLLRLARYWRPALVATLWLSPVLALAAGLIATTHFVDETPFTLSELITTTIVFLAGAIYGGTLLLERDEFEATTDEECDCPYCHHDDPARRAG